MHTSTRTKRRALLALLPVLAAPALSHATEDAAMDSCLKAFLTSDWAKDRKVTVQTENDSELRPLWTSHAAEIELIARSLTSGKQVARVVCRADSTGAIIARDAHPASAGSAQLVSKR